MHFISNPPHCYETNLIKDGTISQFKKNFSFDGYDKWAYKLSVNQYSVLTDLIPTVINNASNFLCI